jgi:hypothetical protein
MERTAPEGLEKYAKRAGKVCAKVVIVSCQLLISRDCRSWFQSWQASDGQKSHAQNFQREYGRRDENDRGSWQRTNNRSSYPSSERSSSSFRGQLSIAALGHLEVLGLSPNDGICKTSLKAAFHSAAKQVNC